ncbi:MAG: hypothetical protein ACR2KX_09135 [Chitinophagaceae bacterium]
MHKNSTIFIFTRDRPEILRKALTSIQENELPKYVIDDSINSKNQEKVLDLCNGRRNCTYLGKKQFNQFILQNNIVFPKYSFLLREPGNPKWNLGFVRNFALLYSKTIRASRVLFMDDDIEVPNLNLIDELFNALNDYEFVGANIMGLIDDSVIGHIATELGVINERMLSGGFVLFTSEMVQNYFLNNYNEDWIWLFLQLKGKKYLQTGEVFQELSNPFSNYQNKLIFQEYGEIALDGILDLYKEGSFDSLTQFMFWERMLKEREEYLDILNQKAKGKKKLIEIIEWIKKDSMNFKAGIFTELFEKYFSDRILFQTLFKSLPGA